VADRVGCGERVGFGDGVAGAGLESGVELRIGWGVTAVTCGGLYRIM